MKVLLPPSGVWEQIPQKFKDEIWDEYTFIWYFAFETRLALSDLFWGQSIPSNGQTFHSVLRAHKEMASLSHFGIG